MILTQHPEFEKYLGDKTLIDAAQNQLTGWLALNEKEHEVLETAVYNLTALFQAYNQVMWQEFPFCQMCLGGCCVVGASEVTAFDAAAMTILGHDLPVLPAQTNHSQRACIYLGAKGCTWPSNWRPLKCMTFFSLGSGNWQLESSDERYDHLTQALQAILDQYLPNIFDGEFAIELEDLSDPIQFATTLSRQLSAQFLPFELYSDNGRFPPSDIDPTSTALHAIADISEQIMAEPIDKADQLLIDLEQFEWVVTGRPAQEKEILTEMNGRYTSHIGEHPVYLHFCQQIQKFMGSIK